MWCLVSPSGEVYNLTPGKIHTVSRRAGDMILANDKSVSRKHACLEVRSPASVGVDVWDDSSMYGTFVNQGITYEKKLGAGIKATIKEGARVRFGLQEKNIWTLKRKLQFVCAHMLKPHEKTRIKSIITEIGGKLLDNWTEDSTHLTTSSLRLTSEVMCALASAKPIVSPQFWEGYVLMMNGNGAFVDPAEYIPPVEDNRLLGNDTLCLPNLARKTIFKDKLFIFPSSQMFKAYKNVIELAGGKASKLSDCGMSLDNYCKPHVVVLSSAENNQTSFYNKLLSTLIEKNRRVIPEEDIGLALWKVSTAVHCNPSYSKRSILLKSEECPARDPGVTLVINTEDRSVTSTGVEATSQVIPPSYSENLFSDEDQTTSFSLNTAERQPPPSPIAGPSRKRTRGSSEERAADKNTQIGLNSKTIKKESPEEEDLFASEDEVSRPSTSSITNNSVLNGRLKATPHEDSNSFFLPSPPRRKKVKKSVEGNEFDFLDLPMEPPPAEVNPTENDNDDFDFLDDSKWNKSTKTVKHNTQCESRDLFETDGDKDCTASSSREGKRKERLYSDSESPPVKKLQKVCAGVTNMPSASKTTTGFLSKNNILSVKKEETDLLEREEQYLSMRLSAKVIITSLIKKQKGNETINTAANSTSISGKNFKKFRKTWSGTTIRHHITVGALVTTEVYRNGRHSTVEDEEEEDPFLPNRRTAPRRKANQSDDEEEDEFALDSFSQFM